MKILSSILISILFIQGIVGEPQIIGNIIGGIVDTSQRIGQGIENTISNVINIQRQSANGGNSSSNFTTLQNSLQNLTQRIGALRRRSESVSSFILRSAIRIGLLNVQNSRNVLQNLIEISKRRFTAGINRINSTINDNKRLVDWANNQRSRFNNSSNSTKEEANKIIDEFIQNQKEQSQKCISNANETIQNSINVTKSFAQHKISFLNNTLNNIDECMKSSYILSIQCAGNLRSNFPKIISIAGEAINLRVQYIINSINGLLNARCIAQSAIIANIERQNLENQLQTLLNNDNATTTSAPDTTTSTTAENETTSESSTE